MNIVRERLANQLLTTPGPAKASDVVRAMGAVQAQDYGGAKWALSQRARGASDEEIEHEITAGKILRTHVLRPTWHFVVPEDIRWMLALTGPRVSKTMSYYNRTLELTPAVLRRTNDALARALEGGKQLTRAELAQLLARSRIGELSGQRLSRVIMQAELDSVVCSGARRGKQFTYGLLDERAAEAPALDRDEALLELTRRYFTARGPATARDFSWWSGLTAGDTRKGIQMAAPELERTELHGQAYWFVPRDKDAPRETPTAHLLPNYDEYFIGFRDRRAIAQRLGNSTLVTGGSGDIPYVVFVNGQIVGGWRRTIGKGVVHINLNLLVSLSKAEMQRVAAAARRYGKFLGLPVALNAAGQPSLRTASSTS